MALDYRIALAPTGFKSLKELKDKKTRNEIARVIDGLARRPEAQGKELHQSLEGLRSVMAGRGRYRVIYKVNQESRWVHVLLVSERQAGRAQDVYAIAQRLLRTFLEREGE